MPRKINTSQVSLVALTAATLGLAMPMPALGQAVADRTLSDVKVENVGGCTTLTVNFNSRIQVLSHFPENSGRELHVRILPLDTAGQRTESLRTPTTVPELRSIAYEGNNPGGPILSLFFTTDMQFEVASAAQPTSLIIRLAKPGSTATCAAPAAPVMPVRPEGSAGTPAALPSAEAGIPAGLYIVNVLSRPASLGTLTDTQQQAIAGKLAYETTFERESQTWHRMRIGFFATRELADAAKRKLLPAYPDAWVAKITDDERTQGIGNRLAVQAASPVVASVAATTVNSAVSTDADTAETTRLIGEAETAIRENGNDRAVQLLTNALAKPANTETPRALELLGVTRERLGQKPGAQAEYEEYLRRYPAGEGADRVRQRLAALNGPAAGPATTPELHAASGKVGAAAAWKWGARGSFSQFYFRDQGSITNLDTTAIGTTTEVDKSVNVNQLMTTADLTISGGNDRRQLQMRAAGSYTKNFGTSFTTINKGNTTFRSKPGAGIEALTALYMDYSDSEVGLSARLGRQNRNSQGVLGRFDGALLGWQAQPKVRVNLVAGFPVLSSRQTYVLKDRHFFGASVDIGNKHSPLQTTFYVFDQQARGGFVDRRSVGLEARFLKSRFNAYTMIDYDVKYKKLNLGLITLNYNFPDTSNLSVTADYRQSPLLTTNNALIGQADPLTFQPIADLQGLRPFFTDPQIYQLAQDRTLVAKSVTVSYSRPISKKLQSNFDFTMTDTGGTPASGGVQAFPETGKEYFYGAQLTGTGLLWGNDIYVLSGRYADTQMSRTYSADFNAGVPITSKFRLSPRARYGYRKDKFTGDTNTQIQPTLKFNYYPVSHSELEIEMGANFTKQRGTSPSNETGFVLSAGYRLDF